MKRAAIYIRVSTQEQADRVSPAEQENDCRQLCATKGYAVARVYRDIEKYKSNGRVVEPSGTRSDRPQFRAMINDAREDRFDVIVAWREDRLYRGFAPLALVADMLDETDIDIELVKESFDRKLMGLKASIAKLELDAIRERTMMGIAARLREGKFHWPTILYGYNYDSENGVTINEEEAHWVRLIWQWFGEGVGNLEIRRRLIEAGAPQKQSNSSNKKRKHQWSIMIIRSILHRDEYYTGIWKMKWGKIEGTKEPRIYEFSIPKIIDAPVYEAVKKRSQQWKVHPAGNWKSNAILAGRVHCAACGFKMGSIKKSTGGGKYTYYYYRCYSRQRVSRPENCANMVRQDEADAIVWGELWSVLSQPGRFEEAIQHRIKELELQETDATADISRLEHQLDDLAIERQKVIGWARKGIISEEDLSTQLTVLTMQEKAARRELQDKQLLVGNKAAQLLDLVEVFRQKVQRDLAALAPGNVPVDEKEALEQFKIKRRFVEALVKRVLIMPDKSYRIEMEAGLSPLPELRDDSLLINTVTLTYD